MKAIQIDKISNHCLTIWFWRTKRKDNTKYHARSVSFQWCKKYWIKNKINPMYKITNNGAKRKNKDSCFDMSIYIGYLIFGYTNWNFNKQL